MQRVSQVAINGDGGAYTVLRCSLMTSKFSIVEDGSANAGVAQGLLVQPLRLPNPGEVPVDPVVIDGRQYIAEATIQVPADQEPFVWQGYPGDHPPNTAPLGGPGSSPNPSSPGGPVTLGTPVLQIKSATATATKVNVTESAA